MVRRARALILVFLMGISCILQGITIVQCQRTGQFYLGGGPGDCDGRCTAESGRGFTEEVCDQCEACMEEGACGDTAAECCPGLAARAFSAVSCYVVVSKGTAPLSAVPGKTKAPVLAPVLAAEPPFMGALELKLRPEGSQREVAQREGLPAPPGRSRVVLYGALRI